MRAVEGCFIEAFDFVSKNYFDELLMVDERHFEDADAFKLFSEFAFVVINSGMKNQIAQKIYVRFVENGFDPSVIGHLGKRKAIETAIKEHRRWFDTLKQMNNKVDYLETLPWIGPITKFHLARNLGIDCAKPDRHLVRLALLFGYKGNVAEMCDYLAKEFGMRVGTVDLILWRYCNNFGSRNVIQEAIG